MFPFYTLGLIASPLLAVAQSVHNTDVVGTGAGPDSRDGSVTVTANEFEEANHTPNATHSVSFNGFSDFYDTPAGSDVPKWSWRVNVTNVPVGSTVVTNAVQDLTFPADASLKGDTDGTVLTNLSSTVGLCAYAFDQQPSNLTDFTTTNDGSCQQTLGDSCVSQMQSYLSSLSSANTIGGTESCPSINTGDIARSAPACIAQGFNPATFIAYNVLGFADPGVAAGYPSGKAYWFQSSQHTANDTETYQNYTAAVNILFLALTALDMDAMGQTSVGSVTGTRALCQRVDTSAKLADLPGAGYRNGARDALATMAAALAVAVAFL